MRAERREEAAWEVEEDVVVADASHQRTFGLEENQCSEGLKGECGWGVQSSPHLSPQIGDWWRRTSGRRGLKSRKKKKDWGGRRRKGVLTMRRKEEGRREQNILRVKRIQCSGQLEGRVELQVLKWQPEHAQPSWSRQKFRL